MCEICEGNGWQNIHSKDRGRGAGVNSQVNWQSWPLDDSLQYSTPCGLTILYDPLFHTGPGVVSKGFYVMEVASLAAIRLYHIPQQ